MTASSPGLGRPEIEAAHRRIAGHVRRTPVVEADGAGLPGPVTLKLELLQHTGSFKARGAFNSLLARSVPPAGVAAASGGNHGAAVAYAARALGHPARIFVPAVAAPAKIARIRSYGAEVVVGGDRYVEALAACRRHVETTGALAIHAYDDEATLAGQGTVALELQSQAPALDTLLVAVGGGGLVGGIAAWYAGAIRVVGVESEGCPTLHAALAAGRPVDVAVSGLAVDSLGATRVGELMFEIAQVGIDRAVLVTDAAIGHAQRWLWEQLRLVSEPGGATALAALLSGRYRPSPGERVGVLLCGANTEPETFARVVAGT